LCIRLLSVRQSSVFCQLQNSDPKRDLAWFESMVTS
jgi:hypothetical protein